MWLPSILVLCRSLCQTRISLCGGVKHPGRVEPAPQDNPSGVYIARNDLDVVDKSSGLYLFQLCGQSLDSLLPGLDVIHEVSVCALQSFTGCSKLLTHSIIPGRCVLETVFWKRLLALCATG